MKNLPISAAAVLVLSCLVSPAAADDLPPPPMREVSPGVYQIGKLLLDQTTHSVTFPGSLNMDQGNLEYLLVTPEGSAHESLLVTGIQPSDLHFAMLLLGAKGSGLSVPPAEAAPPAQIDSEYLKKAPKLQGDAIAISVKWKTGGKETTAPVEDWLVEGENKKPVKRGPWIYTGSMFAGGHFLAQSEGSFAALVTNPSSLINNPRKGNDNDLLWMVNEKAVPPRDTPVEIIITLVPSSKPAK